MNQWQRDKRWSDRFLPEIKRHIGENLISEPPVEEDAERNTDLMVLRLDAIRIGCRIRKNKYINSYGHEFTIRAGRPSGMKTELTKIIEGWGDYFFYGFCNPEEQHLEKWFIGDLKAFRIFFTGQLWAGKNQWKNKNNRDGSSSFMAFSVYEVPGFVVASNWFKAKT